MGSGLDAEFVAVPGADDAHFGFVEGVAGGELFFRQELADSGDDEALAHGSALMGTGVFVGVELAINAKQTYGVVTDIDDEAAAFGHFFAASGDVLGATSCRHHCIIEQRLRTASVLFC